MNLKLTAVIDPRVQAYDGPDAYEAATGKAAPRDITKAEKRFTGPAGDYTFVLKDPVTGKPIKYTQSMTAEEAATPNFSGFPKFPQWETFVAARTAQPIDAQLDNPIGPRFNQPATLPIGDGLQYLFIVTDAEAKALAAELGRGAVAIVQPEWNSKTIIYAPTESRRLRAIQFPSGATYFAADLMDERSNDPTVDNHGGVGQPVTVSFTAEGKPVYTQNLGTEPHNAVMMPLPVVIPAGYQPGLAPLGFGQNAGDEEVVLVPVASTDTSTPAPGGFTSDDRAMLIRIANKLGA